MNPEIQTTLATLLISIMSFLGWQIGDVKTIIPNDQTSFTKTVPPLEPLDITVKLNEKNNSIVPPKKTSLPQTIITPSVPLPQIEPAPVQGQNIAPSLPSDFFSLPLKPEEKIKKSVVNIYCVKPVTGGIEKITGSAVSIDPAGVYLTNAHVAMHIMLEQTKLGPPVSCFIRTGSPATKTYKAEVVYLPPSWVSDNQNILSTISPSGNGKKDYAIIRASESITKITPQPPLPYVETNNDATILNDEVYVVGYPAGFSNGDLLDSSLYKLTDTVTIKNIFSIGSRENASVHTSPTLLAERGSSGGAVTDKDGKLLGIIYATGVDNYSGKKNIQAITMSYIENDLRSDSGKTLDWYIQNAESESKNFMSSKAIELSQILTR